MENNELKINIDILFSNKEWLELISSSDCQAILKKNTWDGWISQLRRYKSGGIYISDIAKLLGLYIPHNISYQKVFDYYYNENYYRLSKRATLNLTILKCLGTIYYYIDECSKYCRNICSKREQHCSIYKCDKFIKNYYRKNKAETLKKLLNKDSGATLEKCLYGVLSLYDGLPLATIRSYVVKSYGRPCDTITLKLILENDAKYTALAPDIYCCTKNIKKLNPSTTLKRVISEAFCKRYYYWRRFNHSNHSYMLYTATLEPEIQAWSNINNLEHYIKSLQYNDKDLLEDVTGVHNIYELSSDQKLKLGQLVDIISQVANTGTTDWFRVNNTLGNECIDASAFVHISVLQDLDILEKNQNYLSIQNQSASFNICRQIIANYVSYNPDAYLDDSSISCLKARIATSKLGVVAEDDFCGDDNELKEEMAELRDLLGIEGLFK